MIAVSEKLSWYVSRSSGIVAWFLVAASIVWGLALSGRLVRRRGIPAWLLDLHRYLGTLSIVFTAIHLIGLVGDNYVHFGWGELFVPMASEWQPGNVAWGIAGFYLLVAIQVTSWAMRRLPRRVWHTIHLSSLVLFVTGTVHSFRAGTDMENRPLRWAGLATCVLIALLLGFRLGNRRPGRRGAGRAGTAAANAAPVTSPGVHQEATAAAG